MPDQSNFEVTRTVTTLIGRSHVHGGARVGAAVSRAPVGRAGLIQNTNAVTTSDTGSPGCTCTLHLHGVASFYAMELEFWRYRGGV